MIKPNEMNLRVGTSGYGYKEWKGSFYPKNMRPAEMLAYYANHFSAVEINNTFYRMPTPDVFKSWIKEVPSDFQFAVKAPQQITHRQRLKDSKETTAAFLKTAGVFKSQLGPILFQLPPNLKKDADRLKQFLAHLPKKQGFTFEFRHASWFDDEILNLLRARNIALCIAESEETVPVPREATADWGYLRLRRLDYTKAALKKWARWIQDQKWTEAQIFFKHEETASGPRFAKQFLEFLQ